MDNNGRKVLRENVSTRERAREIKKANRKYDDMVKNWRVVKVK